MKAEEEEDEDPTGWTLAFDHKGRQYFWHRRTRRTAWEIPETAILRMTGMRKRKKRKKKKLPRGGRALRRLWQWHIHASRVVFPSYVGRPQLPGIIVGMDQYYSLLRVRHRHWQWHFQGWFGWFLLALCSFRSSSGPGCFASWPVWTRRTRFVVLFGIFTWVYSDRAIDSRPALRVAGFTGGDTSRAVLLLVVSGPRCPLSWPAWTTGQCGGSQVQFLEKVFYMPVGVL